MFNSFYQRAFDHLVNVMHSPETAQVEQENYNRERYADILKTLRTVPVFLPVKITLPTAPRDMPIKGSTDPKEKYDVIIVGAITDGENKRINYYREQGNRRPLVKVGEQAAAKISLDAIAGKSKETSGITGIQYFQPFVLRKGDSLSLEIFKDSETPTEEIVHTVFVGYRVLDTNDPATQLNEKTKAAVMASIRESLTPETRWQAIPVQFSDHSATVETPKSDEPLTILGFRTTVSNAMIAVSFNDDEKLARNYFPIWALANEQGNYTQNYNLLLDGIFLEPGEQIYFSIKDTINGAVFAQDGQIEVLLKKP